MNGIHDMGGMHGLGPIAPEVDEPLFHEAWEARILALRLAVSIGTLDSWRHRRELIPGPDYLRMSYYETWLACLEDALVDHGLATREEIASGRAAPGSARATPPMTVDLVPVVLGAGGPADRADGPAPSFAVGRRVRARNLHPTGHTRLPRYVRGREGVITRVHGVHVFPDANAHGLGEDPRPLYQVRFEAAELWGRDFGGGGAVHLDLWEPYLEAL